MIRVPMRAARALAGDGVELGPDGLPLAFRIWQAGDNPTDHGLHRFTDRSAELLMREQAVRGNLYSIDVDHMSLDKSAPPENHRAVGWHRLEVRGGELWAVGVAWTGEVSAGLKADPPAWRYFSPAYDVDKKTREVVSYLNTALTNNPATWSVTALAQREPSMKFAQIMAAIMSGKADRKAEVERVLATKAYESLLADLMGGDEEKKTAAIAKLAAAFPDDDKPKEEEPGDKKKDDADDADKKAKAAKAAKASADEEAAKMAKAKKDAEEPDGDEATKATAKLVATIGEQDRRLKELEVTQEKSDRQKILASRPDLTALQLKALEDEPVKRLPKLLDLIPKPKEDPAAAARVTATRGDTRVDGGGYGAQRAARLPPAEHQDLAKRMGRAEEPKGLHWDPEHPNDLVFPILSKQDAQRMLAARVGAGRDGPAKRPEGHTQGEGK